MTHSYETYPLHQHYSGARSPERYRHQQVEHRVDRDLSKMVVNLLIAGAIVSIALSMRK